MGDRSPFIRVTAMPTDLKPYGGGQGTFKFVLLDEDNRPRAVNAAALSAND